MRLAPGLAIAFMVCLSGLAMLWLAWRELNAPAADIAGYLWAMGAAAVGAAALTAVRLLAPGGSAARKEEDEA